MALPSARDQACLTLIAAFDEVLHRPPSLSEIARGLNLSSTTAADRIVTRLKRRGIVARKGPRARRSRSGGIRILAVGQ